MNRKEIAMKIKDFADELKEKEEPTIAEYLTDVATSILLGIENTVDPLLNIMVNAALIEAEKMFEETQNRKENEG